MDSSLDKFETAFNKLTLFLAGLVATSIGLMAFLLPLNLLMIRLQMGGIWWLFESVEYALYAGVFLGAPWVLQQGAHVKVDVLTSALPKNAAAKLERVLDMAGVLLCLLLGYYGVLATISEYVDKTLPDKDLRIPNWIVLSVFAISFFLLAVEFLLRMRRAKEIVDKEKSAVTEAGF